MFRVSLFAVCYGVKLNKACKPNNIYNYEFTDRIFSFLLSALDGLRSQ